jgi:protein O-GlcNAc transferase
MQDNGSGRIEDSSESMRRAVQSLRTHDYTDAAAAFEAALDSNGSDAAAIAGLCFARTAKIDSFLAHICDPSTDGAQILAMARAVSSRLPRPAKPMFRPRPRRPGRLRIGFLSPDFRRHSCAFFLRSLFAHRDRGEFEFHCFADFQETRADAYSDWFRRSADRWTDTTGMTMPQLAQHIHESTIDILVETAGFSTGSTASVCAYRPARKIVSWLGFPAPTGMPEVGYRIGDPMSDPVTSDSAHFDEKMVRLEGPFLCFTPDETTPNVAALPDGPVRFGSFNAVHKLTLPTARLWAEIVAAVPEATLTLKCRLSEDPTLERFLRRLFEGVGLASNRLILLDYAPDWRAHLNAYAQIHVALDTFPYNGTTTTCEALWMGVPVVALEGARHAARVGSSLLCNAGRPDLVASDFTGYVTKAVALAGDRAGLAAWRRDCRAALCATPLFDPSRWTRLFEAALANIHLDKFVRAPH